MNRKITSIVAVIAVLSVIVITNIESVTKKSDEKYVIKKWQSSYINSTGEKSRDNKINLSNNYWEGGKFSF